MAQALAGMARLGGKLLSGEPLGPAREEGVYSQRDRKNFLHEKRGAERAVEML